MGLNREIAGALLLLVGIILFSTGWVWATIPIRDSFGIIGDGSYTEQLDEIRNYLFWSEVTRLAGIAFIILGITVAVVGCYLIWHNKNRPLRKWTSDVGNS